MNGVTFIDFPNVDASGFRPNERIGVFVVIVDIRRDCTLQSGNAHEDSASDPTICNFCEEAFDGIEPRRTRGCEMNVIPRTACKPCLNFWVFVRRVVVHDQMNIKVFRHRTINVFQEFDELFVTMTRQATFDQRFAT